MEKAYIPRVGVSLKRKTPTPGQNPDTGGLWLHTAEFSTIYVNSVQKRSRGPLNTITHYLQRLILLPLNLTRELSHIKPYMYVRMYTHTHMHRKKRNKRYLSLFYFRTIQFFSLITNDMQIVTIKDIAIIYCINAEKVENILYFWSKISDMYHRYISVIYIHCANPVVNWR